MSTPSTPNSTARGSTERSARNRTQSALFAEIDQLLTASPSSPTPVSDLIESYFDPPVEPVLPKPVHDRRKIHPHFQPKPLVLVPPTPTDNDDDIPLSLLRSARSVKQPLPTHTRSISTPQRQLPRFLDMPPPSATSSAASSSSSTASSLLLATPPPYNHARTLPPVPEPIANGSISEKMKIRHRQDIQLVTNGPPRPNNAPPRPPGPCSPSYPVFPFWTGPIPIPVFCAPPPTDSLTSVIGELERELKSYQIEELQTLHHDMKQKLVQKAKEMVSENRIASSCTKSSNLALQLPSPHGPSSPSLNR